MVRLNKEKNQMEITLDFQAGRRIASCVLQMVFIWCAKSDEDRAVITQMNRMVHGHEDLQGVDLMDYTDKEGLK